jgi:polysaccharide export outer membrane protein
MSRLFVPFFLVIFIFLTSCSLNREIAYFKNQKDTTLIPTSHSFVPTIQSGDILFVGFSSSDPNSTAQFNGVNILPANSVGSVNVMAQSVTPGILVDDQGYIHLHKIGRIYVKGLTKLQLSQLIKTLLIPYLKDPIVSIRFMNYRVTVLGEVASPATYNISNERVSLLEILGMAGDLTAYGNRKNVLIIHENDGKKEFHRINLNKIDLFQSPYFYLHSNDIVYVEPNKAKSYLGSKTSAYLPSVISSVTLLVLVTNIFLR